MKYTPYITVLAVLLAAACAKQEISDDSSMSALPENAVSFIGTVCSESQSGNDAPGTRTVYADEGQSIAVNWAEGDGVGIFCSTGDSFTASNVGYETSASGTDVAFLPLDNGNVIVWSDNTSPHKFYAYYPYSPASEGTAADIHKVPVSLPSVQMFDSADPFGHLAGIDFLYASSGEVTQSQDGGRVSLDFNYLFSVLEVRLCTSLYAVVDAVELVCTDEAEALAFDGATVDIATGTIDVSGAGTSSSIRLEGSQNTKMSDYVSFYMLVSPGHVGKTFNVTAEIGGKTYTVVSEKPAPETGFESGRTYVLDAGQVEIDPEDAEPVTDLSADGTANCYYVTEPGTLYRFRADIKGNGEALDLGGVSYTAEDLRISPADVLVLWYTRVQNGYIPWTYTESPVNIDGISLESDGYVYFRTPEPFIAGNMVLAVLDSDVDYDAITVDSERRLDNADILWSWNIVLAEGYDPDDSSSQFTKGGYTFMTRDLGALIDPAQANTGGSVNYVTLASTTGNVYQWGRKDPFPGLPDYTSVITSAMTSLLFAPGFTPVGELQVGPYEPYPGRVTEGNIFANASDDLCIDLADLSLSASEVQALGTAYPYLWLRKDGQYLPEAKGTWGNPDHSDPVGVKTVYDPCPPGWKVMSKAAWDALTDNESETVAEVAPEGRGALVDGQYYIPFTGGEWWHNTDGTATNYIGSCSGDVCGSYWFDGSYDAAIGWFKAAWNYYTNGQVSVPDITVESRTYGGMTARGCAVRCMKIAPGQTLPESGELDNFDKKDW